MSHAEYIGLLNAICALTDRIVKLDARISEVAAGFSGAFVELGDNTKRIVDALPCRHTPRRVCAI